VPWPIIRCFLHKTLLNNTTEDDQMQTPLRSALRKLSDSAQCACAQLINIIYSALSQWDSPIGWGDAIDLRWPISRREYPPYISLIDWFYSDIMWWINYMKTLQYHTTKWQEYKAKRRRYQP
jgi:hypothetical protein